MTNINWTDSDDTDWRSMSSSIRASFGISALVNIYNYLDSNNTDQSSIYVSYFTYFHLLFISFQFCITIYLVEL